MSGDFLLLSMMAVGVDGWFILIIILSNLCNIYLI